MIGARPWAARSRSQSHSSRVCLCKCMRRASPLWKLDELDPRKSLCRAQARENSYYIFFALPLVIHLFFGYLGADVLRWKQGERFCGGIVEVMGGPRGATPYLLMMIPSLSWGRNESCSADFGWISEFEYLFDIVLVRVIFNVSVGHSISLYRNTFYVKLMHFHKKRFGFYDDGYLLSFGPIEHFFTQIDETLF